MDINATLLGQMITFLLFIAFTKHFVWPPLNKALKDRQGKIADGLAAAERGHQELAQAKAMAEENITNSKKEASTIVLEAKKQADLIVDAARVQAHEEGQRIIHQANMEIEQMVAQAKEQLRQQVATIALFGAKKVLEQSVDARAHSQLLQQLAEKI